MWEEEFIELCFQEMLEEEEQREWFIPSRDLPSLNIHQLQEQIGLLVLDADADVHTDAFDLDMAVSLASANQRPENPLKSPPSVSDGNVPPLPPDEEQPESQRQGVHSGHPETRHVMPPGPAPPVRTVTSLRCLLYFPAASRTFSLTCCQSSAVASHVF